MHFNPYNMAIQSTCTKHMHFIFDIIHVAHLVKMLINITYILNRGCGMVGPIIWFNPPKPGPQSSALCSTVCALSITKSTLLN